MNAARYSLRTPTLLAAVALLLLGGTSLANDPAQHKTLKDVMPVKTQRPSFEYEQCFNQCQQTLDKAMERCDREFAADDPEALSKCRQTAIKRFENALARCPADTGRRARR